MGRVFACGASWCGCRGDGCGSGDREEGGIVGGVDEGDVVFREAWVGRAVFAVEVVNLIESCVSVGCKTGVPLESCILPRLTISAFSPTTSACPIVTHGLSSNANA